MSGRELPTGWVQAELGDIADIKSGITLGKKRSPNQKVIDRPYLRVANVQRGSLDLSVIKTVAVTPEEAEVLKLEEGDILMNEGGDRDKLGRGWIWSGEIPNCIHQNHVFRVRLRDRRIQPKYVSLYANEIGRHFFQNQGKQSVNLASINQTMVAKLPVPIPPYPEQLRIVETIEALTARSRRAREALDSLPALIDRYRQSILAAAFRGDLTADWRATYADSSTSEDFIERLSDERRTRSEGGKRRSESQPMEGVGVLPESWRVLSLGSLAWASSYGTSEKCDPDFTGVPVLRIPNVARGELDLSVLKRASTQNLKDDDSVAPGDLLVVRTNGSRDLLGRGTVVKQVLPESMSYASYLIRFRLVGGSLLAHWINLIWQAPQIRRLVENIAASSAGQYNISMTDLAAFPIPIPTPNELPILCAKVESLMLRLSALVETHELSTARLATLNQSILAKAFRGELVPQDPNDEPASVLLERIRAERAAAGVAPRRGRRGGGKASA